MQASARNLIIARNSGAEFEIGGNRVYKISPGHIVRHKKEKNRIKNNSQVIADISLMNNGLENLDKRSLVYGNLIQAASKNGAALCDIAYWLNSVGLLDLNALKSLSNS